MLAAVALFGCGGAGSSQIAAQFAHQEKKLKVDGPAFSSIVTVEKTDFTPKTTRFMVYVFAANTQPAPTCETITRAGALGELTRGGFVAFTMDKIAEGPGKLDVVELGALMGDSENLFMAGDHVRNVSMTLRTYDGKSFAGDVTTTAGATSTASGTIAGTVCPAATIAMPSSSAVPGESAVVDPSSGIGDGTGELRAPPPEPPPFANAKPKPKPKPKGKPIPKK